MFARMSAIRGTSGLVLLTLSSSRFDPSRVSLMSLPESPVYSLRWSLRRPGDRHEAATIHQPTLRRNPRGRSLRGRSSRFRWWACSRAIRRPITYRSMLSIKGGMDVTISTIGSLLPERRTELVRYDDVQIEMVFEGNGPAVVLLRRSHAIS